MSRLVNKKDLAPNQAAKGSGTLIAQVPDPTIRSKDFEIDVAFTVWLRYLKVRLRRYIQGAGFCGQEQSQQKVGFLIFPIG